MSSGLIKQTDPTTAFWVVNSPSSRCVHKDVLGNSYVTRPVQFWYYT